MAATTVQLPFGRFVLADHYLVSEFGEGVDVGDAIIDRLIVVAKDCYGANAFAYISNRVHSYSVNPLETRRFLASLPVTAVALVTPLSSVVKLEMGFYLCPTQAFTQLDDAIGWVERVVT